MSDAPLCARPDCLQPVRRQRTPREGRIWHLYCSPSCAQRHSPRAAAARRVASRKAGRACRKRADAYRCARAQAMAATILQRLEDLGQRVFTHPERQWVVAGLTKTARDAWASGYDAGHHVGKRLAVRRASLEVPPLGEVA